MFDTNLPLHIDINMEDFFLYTRYCMHTNIKDFTQYTDT